MNILKQSTAATIKLGPFIDDTDGKTAETGLTIAQADIRLSKNGGDFAQKNSATSATHDENGYYDIPLDATDTGTLGRLRIAVSKSGALPVWQDFLVVTANVYDTLCSTDSLDVNVTALANDVIKAASFDESTAFPLKYADTGSTQVARTGADGDTLETLSDEIATVQADLDNPDQYKADVSGIPAAVWGYATRTLSSFGTLIADIWAHATRTLSAFGFTVATQSDANVTAIKAKTDNLPAIPAPAGEYDAELAAIQADLDNPNQYKADVSNLATTAHVQEVEDKVDAIKLKTDNIPANPANEATLTAIKGTGWSDETLVALMNAIEAISVGSGATPQQIWEYVARTLTNPDDYKADVSGLATTTHLQEVENKVDAVGTSVATPATVWAYPDRTLTVSSIRPRPLVDGDQFTIYKDATINIPITKLGDISVYDNLWFTIKREQDLESADDQSVVHMDLLTGMLYLNKQAAVAAQGSITIVDATTGSINILITKEGAALLPVYAREPLRWEVKGIHGEIVDILLQGSCFIQPAVSRKIS